MIGDSSLGIAMHDVVSLTRSNAFRKFCSSNSTSASFPSKIPTTTQPTGGGVWDFTGTISPDGLLIPSTILVVPYGTGTDNATFKMRLIGWRNLIDATLTTIWVPVVLAQYTCTLSATVGVASAALIATERMVDTLTADAMNPSGGVEDVSPTNDLVSHFVADIKGFPIIEATFDMNSSATAANALWVGL